MTLLIIVPKISLWLCHCLSSVSIWSTNKRRSHPLLAPPSKLLFASLHYFQRVLLRNWPLYLLWKRTLFEICPRKKRRWTSYYFNLPLQLSFIHSFIQPALESEFPAWQCWVSANESDALPFHPASYNSLHLKLSLYLIFLFLLSQFPSTSGTFSLLWSNKIP